METDQLKATDEPIPPLDERMVGLNRWQYQLVLSIAWPLVRYFPSRFNTVFGYILMSVMMAVLLATLLRLRNIGRPVFCPANWAYVIGGILVLLNFPPLFEVSLAALVVLLPCIYLPARYEIHRQMDLPGYLLITLLILLAGAFAFWGYRY